MNAAPTVFVVDDDPAVRKSLSLLLSDLHVGVEAFAGGQEFLDRCQACRPGCLLLDIRMPGLGGLDVLDELNRREIKMQVIMITGHGDVPAAVRAMKAGAVDFFEKPYNVEELVAGVEKCLKTDQAMRESRSRLDEFKQQLILLNPSEQAVLHGLVNGKVNKQIAAELGISVRTVNSRRDQILKKLDVASRAELAQLYGAARGGGIMREVAAAE